MTTMRKALTILLIILTVIPCAFAGFSLRTGLLVLDDAKGISISAGTDMIRIKSDITADYLSKDLKHFTDHLGFELRVVPRNTGAYIGFAIPVTYAQNTEGSSFTLGINDIDVSKIGYLREIGRTKEIHFSDSIEFGLVQKLPFGLEFDAAWQCPIGKLTTDSSTVREVLQSMGELGSLKLRLTYSVIDR